MFVLKGNVTKIMVLNEQFTGTFSTITQEINVFTVLTEIQMERIAHTMILHNSFLTSTNGESMVKDSSHTVVKHFGGHLKGACTKQIAKNVTVTLKISIIFTVYGFTYFGQLSDVRSEFCIIF